MNKKNIKSPATLLVLICFICGLSLGIIINDIPYLKFDRELGLGDVSQIFLALVIALLVPFYLNKQINNKRSEKDMIINYCDQQDAELSSLKELIDLAYDKKGPLSKKLANKLIIKTRHIGKKIDILQNLVNDNFSDKEITELLKSITKNQLDCWNYLSVHLRDSRPSLSTDSYENSISSFYLYSENLSKLKIAINKQ